MEIRLSDGDSLQSAYDALPDKGGVIETVGRFDVGDGLTLQRLKPAVFRCPGRPNRSRDKPSGSLAHIYSSTGAPTLVTFDGPNANGYGFEWENIDFEVSPTTTRVFYAPAVNMMRLLNCGAYHPLDDKVEAPFLFVEADHIDVGDDSSWWRLIDNYVRGGALVQATGPNVNQWKIADSICFSKNTCRPMIYLEGAHRCTLRDNNLEGPTTGVHLKRSWGNRLDGNGGEQTDPFHLIEDSNGNLISDMGISYPMKDGVDRVYTKYIGSSADNTILASAGTGMASLYNHEGWIDDQTPDKHNWMFAPSTHSKPERIWFSGLRRGSGNPEGVVKADPGELFQDKVNGEIYVKSSGWGKTGWRKL